MSEKNKNSFETTVASLFQGMDHFISSKTVVGSGCLAGAVAGACCSAASAMGADSRLAAISASLGMAFALEQASAAKGYGAAKSTILDSLCLLGEDCFWEWLSGRARKPSTSE